MFTTKTLRATFALLALALTAAACSDDDSGTSPSDVPAAFLTIGSFDPTEYGNESSDLFLAVVGAGFPVDTTSAQDSTSIAALLAGKQIFFLPEASPGFDAGTRAIIAQWVADGGTIVLVGGYEHTTWLNTAFGWSLANEGSFSERFPMEKLAGASGTPFSSGPATIPGNDGGGYLSFASLPEDGVAIYGGEEDFAAASVAVITVGEGHVIWFGWDWYDGVPLGLQDGGWYKLLRLTAEF